MYSNRVYTTSIVYYLPTTYYYPVTTVQTHIKHLCANACVCVALPHLLLHSSVL